MAVAHDTSLDWYTASIVAANDYNGLTVGGGSDRALLVQVTLEDPTATVTGVTWDQGGTNQAMTQIGSPVAVPGGVGEISTWGLVAPTSGSHTLRVSVSAPAQEMFVGAEAVTGANQAGGTTTFANFNTATGTSTTPSLAISSATGDMTVEMTSGPQVLSAPTQTQIFVNNGGAATGAGMSRAAGAASNTHQWTLAGSVGWGVAGVNIVAAAGGSNATATPSGAQSTAQVNDMFGGGTYFAKASITNPTVTG